jgi:lysophospholipase L1-like esterase
MEGVYPAGMGPSRLARLAAVALAACGRGGASASSSPEPSPSTSAMGMASVAAGPLPLSEAGEPLAPIHFLGRFDVRDPRGPRFAWAASAIAATFTGTGITVQLRDTGTNYFAVVIDGGAPTVLRTHRGTGTYELASTLGAGAHALVLTKRTESNAGTVQLLALTPAGGALVPSREPFARHIEVVGDSISCGYGILGAAPTSHFTAATEDATVAYAGLAAAQLDARATVLAYSGMGLMRDYGGSTGNQMNVRAGLTLADDPTSAWSFAGAPPDVVVILLGTNDFFPGDPGAPFQSAYVALVRQLRGRYPDAHVVCALSPLLTRGARTQARAYIEGAVTELTTAGDARVTYLEFDEPEPGDGYGCDYHPSLATHRKMAAKLAEAIQAVTGW